jgi:hypothetical protein
MMVRTVPSRHSRPAGICVASWRCDGAIRTLTPGVLAALRCGERGVRFPRLEFPAAKSLLLADLEGNFC